MKIVLIGIQGSGKGTLVDGLKDYMDFDLISTGQMLRDEIKAGTDLGKKAEVMMNQGILVSLDLVLEILKRRLASCNKKNIIFDGFPRDYIQAEELNKLTKIDLVLNLNLSKEVAIMRLQTRLTCKDCGYVTSTRTHSGFVCPNCGGELGVRSDENEETMNKRFEVFYKDTIPLLQKFKDEGVRVADIDANSTPDVVLNRVMKVINEYNN